MKNITVRELLELMYEGKTPKQIKYGGKLYQKYKNFEYYDTINKRFLSTVIGAKQALYGMAMYKCITIYDEILDDKEKEYLLHIIKPFKNDVKYIVKIEMKGQEKILICYKDFLDKIKQDGMRMEYTFVWLPTDYTFIELPTFKKGTMYRGMELRKEYTLEELGLWVKRY